MEVKLTILAEEDRTDEFESHIEDLKEIIDLKNDQIEELSTEVEVKD